MELTNLKKLRKKQAMSNYCSFYMLIKVIKVNGLYGLHQVYR
jgi:hypothetical protein